MLFVGPVVLHFLVTSALESHSRVKFLRSNQLDTTKTFPVMDELI